MDLRIDEQNELIRQSLDRYLEKRLPFEARRSQTGADAFIAFWKDLDSELGIGAAGMAEAFGGFGGGREAELVVASSLGAALAVTPYISSNVMAGHLLAALGNEKRCAQIAEGSLIVAMAIEEQGTRGDVSRISTRATGEGDGFRLNGQKLAVEFCSQASLVIVPATLSDGAFAIFALDQSQLSGSLRELRLIDDTPAADIILDDVEVPGSALLARGTDALAAMEAAADRGCAALCAEASGLASVMVADTVEYARQREQFGTAIAAFQALQHRMVDMWAKSREIEAAAILAVLKSDQPEAVSAAKATVSLGLRHIGQEAVQLHGAMGLTEELRVGHYFKRSTAIENKMGNADHHVERYRKLTA